MFWTALLAVLYLAGLATVLAFLRGATILNSAYDRACQRIIIESSKPRYRDAA